MTNWRDIPAASVAWDKNPISSRGGFTIRAMCNEIYLHDASQETSWGAWHDKALGDIADLGVSHWLRCTSIGLISVRVMKWVLDEAASGRCPYLATHGVPTDAYVPSVRPIPRYPPE